MIRYLIAGATLLAALALTATASQAQPGHGHRSGHSAHTASDNGHHRSVPHLRGHRSGSHLSLRSRRHDSHAGFFVGRRHGFSLRPSLSHRSGNGFHARRHAEDRAHEAFDAYRHYEHRRGFIARQRAHEAHEDYRHYKRRAHRRSGHGGLGLIGLIGHSRRHD